MGRGVTKRASVHSLNEVSFRFPYSGSQPARLTLRIDPKFGKDVILQIQRGQFLCSAGSGCIVGVRFDQGKVQYVKARAAHDHSTTHIFLSDYDRFVAQARKAKRVSIEAEFYQEGSQVFEFDASDLKW